MKLRGCFVRGCVCALLLGAAIIFASGCDESYWGDYYGIGAGDGWYDYSFTEYGADGSTRSFSLNPGTSAHDALETYLSDSVIYP